MSNANLPAPPKPPKPESCCGRHCEPCIYDYYDNAFARWEDKVRALGQEPALVLKTLGQTKAKKPR